MHKIRQTKLGEMATLPKIEKPKNKVTQPKPQLDTVDRGKKDTYVWNPPWLMPKG